MEPAPAGQPEGQLAPVIDLFTGTRRRPPSCFICVAAAFDAEGQTVCTLVGEVIDTENLTALSCETYVEDRDAR